jgi:hypothetical protein
MDYRCGEAIDNACSGSTKMRREGREKGTRHADFHFRPA